MASLEGKKAPEFSLDGSDGKKHTLRDYQGKTVVMFFYPKDSTPGWIKEACGFRERNTQIKKLNAVVFGVSKDAIPSHNKFAEKYDLPYVLLSDPSTEVMRKFSAFGKKLMYGKEVQGTIRSTVVIGPKGDVIKHWPLVKKVDEPADEVVAFLKTAS